MNQQFDIVLVQPPFCGAYNFWKSECLGMGYLASSLESHGYSVKIIDAFLYDMSVEETMAEILRFQPRLLLGFSMLSYELYRSGQEILLRLKNAGMNNVHVTFGSWFPTFWHETIIDEGVPVDSIILAEGEHSICVLADYISKGNWHGSEYFMNLRSYKNVLILEQKSTISCIDELLYPRRDNLSMVFEKYHFATVYTSRGCAYSRCTFCSVPSFYKGGLRHRLRSSTNVIGEICEIQKAGVDFVFFTDEDFLGNSDDGSYRAMEIFEGIANHDFNMRYAFNCTVKGVNKELFSKLAKLGLSAVYIGIESNINRSLKRFGKGVRETDILMATGVLRDLGIKLVPGWIMFERDTTLEEVEGSIDFLKNLNAYHVNYLKSLYVMQDTPIERLYGDDLYRTYYYSKYYFKDPRVDLLVRILMNDYLPEVMPYTNEIYPIWHRLLAGFGTDEQQCLFENINSTMRELSLGFTEDIINRIRKNSLEGLAKELGWQVRQWSRIGSEIKELSVMVRKNVKQNPYVHKFSA